MNKVSVKLNITLINTQELPTNPIKTSFKVILLDFLFLLILLLIVPNLFKGDRQNSSELHSIILLI